MRRFANVRATVLALCLCSLSAGMVLCLAAVAIPDAAAQSAADGFGPLDATPPSGMAVEDIIKKFGERESAFAQARENYTFRQSVKVDTLEEDTGKIDGEYQQVT